MIDKSQPIPLYYQVKESLLEKIKRKQFNVGDLIPSESELQENYKVSRITIRRAVQELVQEGHLHTQQGKGTFVSKPKASQELNLITSWVETVTALGMHPESKILYFNEMQAPLNIAKMLDIPVGDKILRLERIRFADDEPICLMTNYLVPEFMPDLLQKGLQRESLYEALERQYSIVLTRAEEIVEAKAARTKEAALLNVRRGAPLLCATRVTYEAADRPVEVVISITRADRYSYKIQLASRNKGN